MVTTGAVRRSNLQSNRHHHQTTDFYQILPAECPSCRLTNSVRALKGDYRRLPMSKIGAVDSLAQGSSVATEVGLLLVHWSSFGRTPFLPPPMTHWGTNGS